MLQDINIRIFLLQIYLAIYIVAHILEFIIPCPIISSCSLISEILFAIMSFIHFSITASELKELTSDLDSIDISEIECLYQKIENLENQENKKTL